PPTPVMVTAMPAAVVNHLRFREAHDPDLFARAEEEVVPQARNIEGFRGLHVVQVAPDHFILIITGDNPDGSQPGRDGGRLTLDDDPCRAAPGVAARTSCRAARYHLRLLGRQPGESHAADPCRDR